MDLLNSNNTMKWMYNDIFETLTSLFEAACLVFHYASIGSCFELSKLFVMMLICRFVSKGKEVVQFKIPAHDKLFSSCACLLDA